MSQTDLFQRWHCITAPHLNSLSALEWPTLSPTCVKSSCVVRCLIFIPEKGWRGVTQYFCLYYKRNQTLLLFRIKMTKTVTRHKSWMVMSCSNIVDHFDYIRQQHPFKDDMHLSIDVKTNKKALYFLIKSCVNLSVTDFFCFQLRRWPSSQPPLHVCNLSGGDWSSS